MITPTYAVFLRVLLHLTLSRNSTSIKDREKIYQRFVVRLPSHTSKNAFFGMKFQNSGQNARKFKSLPNPKTRAQDEVFSLKIRWKPASKPFSSKQWKPAIVWQVFPIVWSDLLCYFEWFHARIHAHVFQPSRCCRWKILETCPDEPRDIKTSQLEDSFDVLLSNSHANRTSVPTTQRTRHLSRVRQREPLTPATRTCFVWRNQRLFGTPPLSLL